MQIHKLLLFIGLLLFVNESRAETKAALFVVHFETGPSWEQGVAPNKQAGFSEHANNLNTLRKQGTIKFGARYRQYGMIFLSAQSLQHATQLLNSDPGVKSGLFKYNVAEMNVFYPYEDSLKSKDIEN